MCSFYLYAYFRLSHFLSTYFCSALKDGFELPSHLAVSTADCLLVITEYLTKVIVVPKNRQKSSDSSAPNQRFAILAW